MKIGSWKTEDGWRMRFSASDIESLTSRVFISLRSPHPFPATNRKTCQSVPEGSKPENSRVLLALDKKGNKNNRPIVPYSLTKTCVPVLSY